jgi:hypothetical protein
VNGTLYLGTQGGAWLLAINAANGSLLWKSRLSEQFDPEMTPVCVHNGQILVTADTNLLAFDAKGNRLWQWDTEERLSTEPIRVLPQGLLIGDHARFYRYALGTPAALPENTAKRREMAQKLVARFDRLSEDEKRRLYKLGDEAFEALFPLVQKRLTAYIRAEKNKKDDSYDQYSLYSDALEALEQVTQPKHTQTVLTLLPLAKPPGEDESAYSTVLQLLAAKGDPEQTIPLFLDILQKPDPSTSYSLDSYSIGLRVIAQSKDTRAVAALPPGRHDAMDSFERGCRCSVAALRRGGETPAAYCSTTIRSGDSECS